MSVAALGMGLTASLGLTGCFSVKVDKDANGKEKTVQVETPFGGVHVNTDQTTAADLGLPVYPGAQVARDDDKHKSADVHLGFGDWQLRIKAVSYSTSDSQDKVAAFYKKALGRYGEVITCQGSVPVGTPTVTGDGLTCDDKGKNNNKVNYGDSDLTNGYQLKTGSKRHQHIVGFEDPKDSKTRFVLVALDLPANMEGDGTSE
jgi:hypothetical protein